MESVVDARVGQGVNDPFVNSDLSFLPMTIFDSFGRPRAPPDAEYFCERARDERGPSLSSGSDGRDADDPPPGGLKAAKRCLTCLDTLATWGSSSTISHQVDS